MDEPLENSHPTADEEPAAPERGAATLHRSATKKVFGGVAGGLAERFDVDANIVRVVFVVLAVVYGLGIAIYLAMWALIPRADTPEGDAVEVEDAPRVRWLRYAIPLGVVVLAIVVLAALHNMTALGLPFAILWLIFLVVIAVLALFTPARRLTFRRLLGLLFLAGLSFLILISGVFIITVHEIGVPVRGGSGVKNWSPTTLSEVQRTYRGAIGASTIDLSHVSFSGTTYVTVTQGVGALTVDVPQGVKLYVKTHAGLGDVLNEQIAPTAVPPKEQPGAVLVMNLQVGIGQIQVCHVNDSFHIYNSFN
ncbi:MAG: PspC domain-containing protein [Acidimicrobiales bacterium]